MSAYRPAFEAGLRLFARASEAMKARGFLAPVLVGGAAVELYSASAIATGDFDIAVVRQEEFEEELLRQGCVRPGRPGQWLRGLVHPELRIGFEVVADRLLDGLADRDRCRAFSLDADGIAQVLSLEDVIADRVGQYASGTAADRLDQARVLFVLYPDADTAYLERRIREETGGDHGIDILTG